MTIFTILGGTGSTGSAVIRALISSPTPPTSVHIYVRSKDRLLKTIPALSDPSNLPFKLQVFEGTLTDKQSLSDCIKNSSVIFSCIATNYSAPDTRVCEETAAAIISSLGSIRDATKSNDNELYEKPTVIYLSSASMDPVHNGGFLIECALFYAYKDLRVGERLYRETVSADPGLLNFIFARPPGIMPGEVPTGHKLSLTEVSVIVSYADLGAGMVEMAQNRGEYGNKAVLVSATGKVKQDWVPNIKHLLFGMFCYFFPGLWRLGVDRGYF